MADFIISIDQGTTSSRAILFNLKGKRVNNKFRKKVLADWNKAVKRTLIT